MEKPKLEHKTIGIVIDPKVSDKLDKGAYNKSKLVDILLTAFFEKEKKKHK